MRESLRLSAFYIAHRAGLRRLGLVVPGRASRACSTSPASSSRRALSIDNVFVISLIFTYFAIPRQYQYRALFWGILGVIVLRGIMIGLGAALVQQFSWVLYIFGAFLMLTGIKMLVVADDEPDIANNPILRFLEAHMRVTDELHGGSFFVRQPDPADRQAGPLRDAAVPGAGA